jgi:DNA-binding NtrC family response regulator
MHPPDAHDSRHTDWALEVALVPGIVRSILITGGEPGYWRFAAQSLHRSGAFVAIACGERDEAAFERGLGQCSGGILLLQDIDLASSTQQERIFRFLGARQDGGQPSTRVIAGSTHRLFDLVTAGVFDEALFYRLNTWHIVLDEQ